MRTKISDLPRGVYDYDGHPSLADRQARRYRPFSFDFDSTALGLSEPEEHWDEKAKQLHREHRAQAIERLKLKHGTARIEEVIMDTVDLGPKSMSLLAYHNELHEQARRAFVAGAYYPALVAACALVERILNHLVLDLREFFKSSSHYKKVYRKESFDNWEFITTVLTDWNVLADGVGSDFLALNELRNRSIHFNPETYQSLRGDALSALQRLNSVIAKQFGYFGSQPWFIERTPGVQFVKKAYEHNAFVRAYIIPRSGFVGFLHGMEMLSNGTWTHLDYDDYGDEDLTDDEFAARYREREPTKVVSRELIEKQTPRASGS
jgi:hypothetical protein